MSQVEIQEQNRKDELIIIKGALRAYSKTYSEKAVLAVARGIHDESTECINHETERDILDKFKEVLETDDLS